MSKKLFQLLTISSLALGAASCSLEEVRDGEFCPDNTKGRYADDSFSEIETAGAFSSVMKGDFCAGTYPYCIDNYCAKCPEGSMKVKPDDNETEIACMDCYDLDLCDSDSCLDAKRKNCNTKCKDGKLYSFDDEFLQTCQFGCNNSGDSCIKSKLDTSCEIGKIPNEDGECECNTDENWIDTGDHCECRQNYHQEDDRCIPDAEITDDDKDPNTDPDPQDEKDPREDPDPGVITNPEINCGIGEVPDENGECICDREHFWTGSKGSCQCIDTHFFRGGQCINKVECGVGEKYIESDNTCVCDTANHWTGDPGSCNCINSYHPKGNECVATIDCGIGEIYVEEQNDCICDTTNNWTGNKGGCVCAPNFLSIENRCEAPKTCLNGASLNRTDNTCYCDPAGHWTGDPKNCQCEAGFLNVQNQCQQRANCGTGAKLDESTNTCYCDTKAHWTGTPTSCDCMFGYSKSSTNSCVLKKAGDTINFGNYFISSSSSKSAISWKILEVVTSGDKYNFLLASEKGLDAKKFNTKSGTKAEDDATSWNNSDLKKWLNEDFYNAAFSPDNKTLIKTVSSTKVTMLKSCSGGLCAFGTDTVFLKSESSRKLKPTTYAYGKMKDQCTSTGYCYWWLATTKTVSGTELAKFVNKSGEISTNGTYKDETNMVRPILWVIVNK